MNELTLVKSDRFGEIQCDFYGDGEDFWMTRTQVGTALEYSNPGKAIKDIHMRHKDRLDKYSRVAQIEPPSGGGVQNTTIYNRKGIMEICRHSDQPKADAFMDFCWEVMDRPIKENDHCLTGDTLVDTVCGQYRIDELVGKCGYVYCAGSATGTGGFHDVRMTQKEAEVFEVTLSDGRSVKATADHPILTRRGWVQIKDLRGDDEIACIEV